MLTLISKFYLQSALTSSSIVSSSTVTYTSVYINSKPWRFHWVSSVELEAPKVAPQSSGQAPSSLDFVIGPKHPPSPDYVQEASEDDDEEKEEHPAPADSFAVPIDDLVPSAEDTKVFETDESAPTPVPSPRCRTARMSVRPQTPMSATAEALIAEYASAPTLPSPPPSLLSPISSTLHQIPSPPLPLPSPPTTSLTYDEAPLSYRAAGIQLRAASPPTHHPSEIPSPSLSLLSTSHRDDLHEAHMSLHKRARFTAPINKFKVGESSAAATARQSGLDVTTMDATPGRPMSREVGYGIEDVWDDMVREMKGRAPTTLEDLRQRVTDLSTTLAQDTYKIYVRLEDAQDDRALQRTRVNTLFRDRRYHLYITTRDACIGSIKTLVATLVAQTSSLQTQLTIALRRIQTLEARKPTRTDDQRMLTVAKMPLKRTVATTTPMTDAQIKALISQGVADALAKHEANRSRNGDDSHDSGSDGRWRMPVARECTYTNFLKHQPLNSKGNALTWWNSHVRTVSHDVAYAMTWKTIKKMITDKYFPKELALMCGMMFIEESDEVEKYVGGLPDMIQGSMMASKPKKMHDAIEFATELMDKKIRTIAEHQVENKRKFEDTSRNNQNQQQPFKTYNVARAYMAGPGEKQPYGGSKPLCHKCNNHHDRQCAPKCTNCKRTSHLTRDCRSQPAAVNNQRTQGENQRVLTCFECGAQGHFKSNFLKLKIKNQGVKNCFSPSRI
nr:hypothetical protein [Tanacetum cinerariifolium]